MEERPIMIVDGLNLFMRHYIAHPAMSNNGEQVGGIVGFLNSIANIGKKIGPSEIYVVWESGGSNKKRGVYKDYKKNKKPQKLNRYYEDIPDTISNKKDQIKILVQSINYTPIRQIYVQNCEADDAIGYMCKYKFKDQRKIILSSDHDYYQLLNNSTIIWSPTKKDFVTKKSVKEKYAVSAENFCLAKSISGDQSDNIPGVKGVSYKTLAKIVPDTTSSNEIGLNELFEYVKKQDNQNTKLSTQRILKNETLIRRNWRLVRLDTNNINLEQIKKIDEAYCKSKGKSDKIGLIRFFNKLGISNLNIDNLFLTLKTLQR